MTGKVDTYVFRGYSALKRLFGFIFQYGFFNFSKMTKDKCVCNPVSDQISFAKDTRLTFVVLLLIGTPEFLGK